MARRKSMEEIIRPGGQYGGVMHALKHAVDMKGRGLLSEAEANRLQRLFAAEILNSMDGDDLERAMANGDVDRLQEMGGYDDEEDQDEADGLRNEAAIKVIVHFFAEAAQLGVIEPERALEALAQYIEVPEADDPREVIDALMGAIRAKPDETEREKSGKEQVDDYMASRYGKRRRG